MGPRVGDVEVRPWCSSDLIALFVSVVGSLPLEKRGEFRLASGAAIPNFGKIEIKSTDESGIERSIRGHITEVDNTSPERRGGFQELFSSKTEDFLLERNSPVVLDVRAVLVEHRVWKRHTMRTCELAMSNRSLHRSSHSMRVGPGWT